jgi:hypothetical protein
MAGLRRQQDEREESLPGKRGRESWQPFHFHSLSWLRGGVPAESAGRWRADDLHRPAGRGSLAQ